LLLLCTVSCAQPPRSAKNMGKDQNRLWGRRSHWNHLFQGIGFPGLFAGHKDTEGHDRYECKLLCEQRRNLL